MNTVTTTATRGEVQDQILSYLAPDSHAANGSLEERTYARLREVVQKHFDGIANHHSFDRIDWRVIQRFFAHIFAQGTPAWTRIGEELYGEMQYLNDPPPLRNSLAASAESQPGLKTAN